MSEPGKPNEPKPNELVSVLTSKIVGQPVALQLIVPYIQMYQAGLAPQGRPIGVFLLLGPTGTGKTRTVEVLAEVLHGSHKNYLRIDCGEFQMDHEVARLIGAPPGYLGHRETKPLLSEEALSAVTSTGCDIALVLLDEIEKAAPSLTQMLLGVLDKATLKLGDNSEVDFERSLIFLTSNLGAREMMKELGPSFGFTGSARGPDVAGKLESIAMGAVRKRFSPEFINRIDAVVTYQPLAPESLRKILDNEISELQEHVKSRLGPRCFEIEVTEPAKSFLLDHGTSPEYGARELKRTVHRYLTQPLATLVADGGVGSGGRVVVRADPEAGRLTLDPLAAPKSVPAPAPPQVLIVDDNLDLLKFLVNIMRGSKLRVVSAQTAFEALQIQKTEDVDAAIIDYMLPDLNGLELSSRLRAKNHSLPVVMMTGGRMSADEEDLCRKYGIPLIQKPFLLQDVLALIQSRLSAAAVKRGAA